jgi:preprotein translocase subunit SecA
LLLIAIDVIFLLLYLLECFMSFMMRKIFKSYSEREVEKISYLVDAVNVYEEKIKKLSDQQLKNKTNELRNALIEGEMTLDDILPEAFAVVCEASYRVLTMRPFNVQIQGGIILHQGRIAEMRTGEGKTLVSVLPAYLNALEGRGVHVVTVNDYLAQRDHEWVGEVLRFLDLKTGCVLSSMSPAQRREAYKADVVHVTNSEVTFDYLRDNMAVSRDQLVLRDLNYAIIDEVDSILIDEARTPLIISASAQRSTKAYGVADIFAKQLVEGKICNEDDALNPIIRADIEETGDYVIDEKANSVTLTQEGITKAEKFYKISNYSDPEHLELQHYNNNALKANYILHADKDYVVKDDEIIIVDEFTGRLMIGRRYSDGLHQAIEAKEGVKINGESKTLATITYQNFFNKYTKKCGMTGTAITEQNEFREIYGMDVVAIVTNRPVVRIDHHDCVYKTENAKFKAIIDDVKKSYIKGQPVLIGTVTIDKSEKLSKMLKKENIKHNVLNAKYHEKEAEMISQAGQERSVTVATNMAGRGTDIKLTEEAKKAGGLKVIGTERHESRRIDNQ